MVRAYPVKLEMNDLMETEEAFSDFADQLARVRDVEAMLDLLNGVLTPQERHKLALRWQILQLLQQGVSQRAIAKELGISLCNITRGSRELKEGSDGLRKIVARAAARRER